MSDENLSYVDRISQMTHLTGRTASLPKLDLIEESEEIDFVRSAISEEFEIRRMLGISIQKTVTASGFRTTGWATGSTTLRRGFCSSSRGTWSIWS